MTVGARLGQAATSRVRVGVEGVRQRACLGAGLVKALDQLQDGPSDPLGQLGPGVDNPLQIWRKMRCLARCRVAVFGFFPCFVGVVRLLTRIRLKDEG